MAAYCRVSTAQEEQLSSYENQVKHYKKFIGESKVYEMAGIYADEGISATNTKKRDKFNQMIMDCRQGKIDMIITKSISRFARNTLDCLNYVRELRELGIGVIFEKENINTLDAKGEVLLTILSSLAQDESRSISENSTWGIRKRFEAGQHKMATKRFLGYDTDEKGKLIINPEQAKIVERIYEEYLNGKTVNHIKRDLEREKIKNWNGKAKWESSTIKSMLRNEKYKGDAILQKSYTVDFLTKKREKNNGQLRKYLIEDDHEAIIDPLIWEAVQLEYSRRKGYLREHKMHSYAHRPEKNPFTGKVICGSCNKAYRRKGWKTNKGYRKVWQCQGRYREKGVMVCPNRHIDEETLEKALIISWNSLLDGKEEMLKKWELKAEFGKPLDQYRALQFSELIETEKKIKKISTDFILKTLDNIRIYDSGRLIVKFMEGTEIELKGE
jgi:DNA invertase Pin-like site-specific DNA recombinase